MPGLVMRVLNEQAEAVLEDAKGRRSNIVPFGFTLIASVTDVGVANTTSATVCYPEGSDSADC
jgi:hypothetical protein